MRRILPFLLLALGAMPAPAATLHLFDRLALAPKGDRVAAVEREADPDATVQRHGQIVVRATGDGAVLARLDPCKTCGYSDPAYARDGRLAFIARDRAAGIARLMVASGVSVRTIASVDGLAERPRWSPDGRTIALLVTEGARKETGAVNAGVREVGEIGQSFDEQRLGVVPADGGALRLVSPADRFVYDFAWTPDGKGFVATDAPGNGDANWWVATLDAIDAASGAMRRIASPPVQMNFPQVSPDGRTVAFIGGLMSDLGSVGGDVWTVPFAGGAATNVTSGFRGSFTTLHWDASGLEGAALVGDRLTLLPVDPVSGVGQPHWQAPVAAEGYNSLLVFDGGRVAMAAQDWEHGPAILAGSLSAPARLTHDNDGYAPIVSARSITWKSDGFDVQGWLLAPRGAPATAKAPMVTIVHGGPAAATVPSFVWEGNSAALIRAGYWLFYPNPRGSYGQGEAFTAANKRDFGGGDLRDDLAGIDAVLKTAPVDPQRLGLMGGSYGGFTAMWANTQTNRFRAIQASAGISDWLSYYGTNGINTWMIPYLGKSVYDDPKPYWDMSAIQFVRRAKTPTLITVGERDIEVPAGQSVEYWNALKAMGVPTSLVIYPDEGHHLAQLDHIADQRQRVIAWFDRYLKGETAP